MAASTSPRALLQVLDAHPETLAQAQSALKTLLTRLHSSLQHQRLDPADGRGVSAIDSSNDEEAVWESASPASPAASPATSSVSPVLSVSPASDGSDGTALFTETRDALTHWLAASSPSQQTANKKSLPLALWLLLMEISACVVANTAPVLPSDPLPALLKTVSAPIGFPSSSAHCDAAQQIAFSCSLWDALVASALLRSTAASAESVLNQLADTFVHWLAVAMRGFEVVFLGSVGSALLAHITESVKDSKQTQQCQAAVLSLLMKKTRASGLQSQAANASEIAVAVLVLRGCGSSSLSERELEQLRFLVVTRLKSDPFPHVHDPQSVIGMALGVSSSRSAPAASRQQTLSWASVLVQQFALLRSVNLSLLSFRLGVKSDSNQQQQPISSQTLLLQQSLTSVMRTNYDSGMAALSFQMVEKCVVEATTFFRSSVSASYAPLVRALQSVYPSGLLRDIVISYVDASETNIETTTARADADTGAILRYLKALYSAVSSTLQALTVSQPGNTNALLLAFLTLSKLEFARESCASPETNASMNALTQQVEDAIESSPNHVLSTLLRSVVVEGSSSEASKDVWPGTTTTVTSSALALSIGALSAAGSVVPLEVDVIYSTQALVVGVILQRKLRVLLFQSAPLVDDALALVFSGLYSGYEPLSSFAHSFLGFCLTHLGQYISIYSIAPHYLQVTLAKYPVSAPQATLAKTCGVIFGALFYAQAQATTSSNSSTTLTTRLTQQQRMVLWAIKQCCDRVAELVLTPVAPDATAAEEKATSPNSRASGLYLAGIVFEVMKMAPIELLVEIAMEIELLLSKCAASAEQSAALHALKTQLFASISQNCDAEKRAWLAAWYVELAMHYPSVDDTQDLQANESAATTTQSRL